MILIFPFGGFINVKKEMVHHKTFRLGELLHDCDLICFSADINRKTVSLIFRIHPLGPPSKPVYVPDRIEMIFEKIVEVTVRGYRRKDRKHRIEGAQFLQDGWITSIPLKNFENANKKVPMCVDNIDIVLTEMDKVLSMSGHNDYDCHDLNIKWWGSITCKDETGSQKTLEELVEIGRRYWEEYSEQRNL